MNRAQITLASKGEGALSGNQVPTGTLPKHSKA